MWIGVCRVVLALPGNDSLKGKRAVVKSVLARARQRFHVTAAEIADLDQHRRATLGFGYVSNDARHARSVIDQLLAFIGATAEAPLVEQSAKVERVDLAAAAPWEPREVPGSAGDSGFDADDDDVGVFEDRDGDDEEG